MPEPRTDVVLVDRDGTEFRVCVAGHLTDPHRAAVVEAKRLIRARKWAPVGMPRLDRIEARS